MEGANLITWLQLILFGFLEEKLEIMIVVNKRK